MRYIKDQVFKDYRKGVSDKSFGEAIAIIMGDYVPVSDMVLPVSDIRSMNRAIDIFEAGPDSDGFFGLEDADFQLVKKIVVKLAEHSLLARSTPFIQDVLNEAITAKVELVDE